MSAARSLSRPAVASRRRLVAGGLGLAALALARDGSTTPAQLEAALREIAGEAGIRRGRVRLDVPPLVENGNVVPVTVAVDSPMNDRDFVARIALFNERNPQPYVAVFHLGPRAGRAIVETRMRLATSQRIVAVAELGDGTFWSAEADVIVTLAACVEG